MATKSLTIVVAFAVLALAGPSFAFVPQEQGEPSVRASERAALPVLVPGAPVTDARVIATAQPLFPTVVPLPEQPAGKRLVDAAQPIG
jgi:hypothetical protein